MADLVSFPERSASASERLDYFQKLYSNWLIARGEYERPVNGNIPDELGDRENEAARLLFITPAQRDFQVWQKIEALEYYLACDSFSGHGQWTDRRHIAYFGCIKADLLRLGIGIKS